MLVEQMIFIEMDIHVVPDEIAEATLDMRRLAYGRDEADCQKKDEGDPPHVVVICPLFRVAGPGPD